MSILQAARGQGQRFSEDLLHVREFCVQSNTSQVHQRAKKVVSDSPGLVDFAFGLVNSVLNLPDGQVNFLGKFKLQKDGNQSCDQKGFLG